MTGVWILSVGSDTIEHMFETMTNVIPDGLDRMEPGLFLAAVLSTVDVDRVSSYDRIVVLRAQKRMASHYEAQALGAMAAVARPNPDDADPALGFEAAATEIGAGLRLTRRAADTELSLAVGVSERLPRVLQAMSEGVVDRPRARVMIGETAHLNLSTARKVIDQVIDRAPRLTTGQLRALIRRLSIESNPKEAEQRYEQAVDERCFITEPTDTGTADVFLLNIAPEKAAAAADHINYLAKHLKRAGETRTMDQLRADIALDLLCGNSLAAPTRRGVVDISVSLKTLTELSQTPGDIAGYGPVVADISRQVAANQTGSEWRWTLKDENSGQPIIHGITSRRPTASQARTVQTLKPTCVFPGCRMPATQTDLDHTQPWSEGGPTTIDNLAPLCRHHHTQRHQHRWTHHPLPDGDHHWTSPLGHSYTTTGRGPP